MRGREGWWLGPSLGRVPGLCGRQLSSRHGRRTSGLADWQTVCRLSLSLLCLAPAAPPRTCSRRIQRRVGEAGPHCRLLTLTAIRTDDGSTASRSSTLSATTTTVDSTFSQPRLSSPLPLRPRELRTRASPHSLHATPRPAWPGHANPETNTLSSRPTKGNRPTTSAANRSSDCPSSRCCDQELPQSWISSSLRHLYRCQPTVPNLGTT